MPEAEPHQSDPYDIDQRLEIHPPKSLSRSYLATSVDLDEVHQSYSSESIGSLNTQHPKTMVYKTMRKDITHIVTTFPTILNTNVLVGKWYVPFMFVCAWGNDATNEVLTEMRLLLVENYFETPSWV